MRRALLLWALLAAACHRAPEGAGATVAGGICGAQGWCWVTPQPIGVAMNSLWASGPGDLWAVGQGGAVLHHDGRRWTMPAVSGSVSELFKVAGRGPGDAWAIGEYTVLRLQGDKWTDVPLLHDKVLPYHAELKDLLVLPSGEAWVVGGLHPSQGPRELLPQSCVIGRFRDGRWSFDVDHQNCAPLTRVWAGKGADDVWAEGDGAVVHWNGKYLTKNPRSTPPPRRGLHGQASGWQLQDQRTLARAGSPSTDARDFWAFGPDDVWAINSSHLTHFDGRAWHSGEVSSRPRAMAARSPGDIWLLSLQPELAHFDGRGWTVSPLPKGTAGEVVTVAAPPGDDVWVLTEATLLRFARGRWTEVKPPAQAKLHALVARSNDDVWVGGDKVLLHWDGRALKSHPTSFDVQQLADDGRELWAAPPLQRWNGSAFVPVPELSKGDPTKLHLAGAAGSLWVSGPEGLFRWKAGKAEEISGAGKPLWQLWVSPDSEVWVFGSSGLQHASARVPEKFGGEEMGKLGRLISLGGGGGLVWVISEDGVLMRPAP